MQPFKEISTKIAAIGRPIEASEIADIECFMLSEEAKIKKLETEMEKR